MPTLGVLCVCVHMWSDPHVAVFHLLVHVPTNVLPGLGRG